MNSYDNEDSIRKIHELEKQVGRLVKKVSYRDQKIKDLKKKYKCKYIKRNKTSCHWPDCDVC